MAERVADAPAALSVLVVTIPQFSTHSDVLHQTIDNAVQYQAHFLEISSSDILDPTLVERYRLRLV